MVNKLQTKRSPETIKKIKDTLRKRYNEQGGMKQTVKDKISQKMRRNWELKRQEEAKNNQLKTGKDDGRRKDNV